MQTSAVYSLPLSYFWKLAFPREERDNWDLQNENMEALADLPLQKRKYLEREREREALWVIITSLPLWEKGGEKECTCSHETLEFCPGVFISFFFSICCLFWWLALYFNELKAQISIIFPIWFEKGKKKTTSGSISTEHLHICYELLPKHKDLNW